MAGSTLVWLSYAADWIVIVLFASAGGALNRIDGFHRPFTLSDSSIAYPLKPDIVSLLVAGIISGIGPAVIIGLCCVVSALLHRRRAHGRSNSFARRAMWELHVGWLGLGFALATTLFVTSGLKDVVGKPRPDLLARCIADLANIDKYIVGGFGVGLESDAAPLVSSAICRQKDSKLLDDGFASFPSGHSSFSSAGMVYLSLWLCARWSVAIPFMDHTPRRRLDAARDEAAPPLWQVAVCLAPVGVALFICSTRYADFHHAGVDIVAGAALGTVLAWSSFRLFHLPVSRGRGLVAWGPRSHDRAFLAGLEDTRKSHDEERGHGTGDYELRNIGHIGRGPSGSSGDPFVRNT